MLTGSIRLPGALYRDNARVNAFWDELQRRAEALPGVAAVAFADGLPPNTAGQHNNFDLEQYPTPSGESQPVTPWVAVTPEYVRTLGLTLVEGRLLDERDPERNAAAEALLSVMVDRAWARRFFPNESAVGKRLREGGCTTCPWTTVVGVVSDVKYDGISQPNNGTVYSPLSGSPARFLAGEDTGRSAHHRVVVATGGSRDRAGRAPFERRHHVRARRSIAGAAPIAVAARHQLRGRWHCCCR